MPVARGRRLSIASSRRRAFLREKLVAGGIPAGTITVKPHGVDDPGARAAPPSSSRSVLFVGRLSHEKGADTLLDAWAHAWRVDARAGAGRRRTAARAARGSERGRGAVRRLAVAEPRSPACCSARRALVFPSVCYENLPRAVVEAMAAGLPVLASDHGGPAELARELGPAWTAAAGDDQAWADALAVLDDDAAVDVAGARARAGYERHYTNEASLAGLLDVYASVGGTERSVGSRGAPWLTLSCARPAPGGAARGRAAGATDHPRPPPRSPMRPRRGRGRSSARSLRLLPLVLAGYALFDRAFAWLHLPGLPLFPGELMTGLALMVIAVATHTVLPGLKNRIPSTLLLAFILWGVLRTVPYIGTYHSTRSATPPSGTTRCSAWWWPALVVDHPAAAEAVGRCVSPLLALAAALVLRRRSAGPTRRRQPVRARHPRHLVVLPQVGQRRGGRGDGPRLPLARAGRRPPTAHTGAPQRHGERARARSAAPRAAAA